MNLGRLSMQIPVEILIYLSYNFFINKKKQMLIFGSEVNVYILYIILFLCIAINVLMFFFHLSDSFKDIGNMNSNSKIFCVDFHLYNVF